MVASVDCFCWRDHPHFHGPGARTVLLGNLKYVDERGRAAALFDLSSDPSEARDVSAARAEDARRLAGELEQWRARLRAPPATSDPAGDAAREEALRALGYVQ
jgi:hypothetical protein